MRFLAAPWVGLLSDGTWLRNAKVANERAQSLAAKLHSLGFKIVFPCEASGVFIQLSERIMQKLQKRGWHFYKFVEPDIYRMMCAWSITAKNVDELIADISESL